MNHSSLQDEGHRYNKRIRDGFLYMERLEVNTRLPDQFGITSPGELNITIRGLTSLRIWITLFNKHHFIISGGNKVVHF